MVQLFRPLHWAEVTPAEEQGLLARNIIKPTPGESTAIAREIDQSSLSLNTKAMQTDLKKGADSKIVTLLCDIIPSEKLNKKKLSHRGYRLDNKQCDQIYAKAAKKVESWLTSKEQEASEKGKIDAYQKAINGDNENKGTKETVKDAKDNYKKVGGPFRFFRRRNRKVNSARKVYQEAKDIHTQVTSDLKDAEKHYDEAVKRTAKRRKAIDDKISKNLPAEDNSILQEYIEIKEGSIQSVAEIVQFKSDFNNKVNELRDIRKSTNEAIHSKFASVDTQNNALENASPPENVADNSATQPQANEFDDGGLYHHH